MKVVNGEFRVTAKEMAALLRSTEGVLNYVKALDSGIKAGVSAAQTAKERNTKSLNGSLNGLTEFLKSARAAISSLPTQGNRNAGTH